MNQISAGEVTIPISILNKWRSPKKIYKSALGCYIDGLTNMEEFRSIYGLKNSIVRYVSTEGLDSNNGLSELTAFRTVQRALQDHANTIYIKAGIYSELHSNFASLAISANIIGYGGEVYLGRILGSRTWRQNQQIISCNEPYTSNITHLFSVDQKEKTGMQMNLTKVLSEDECKTTPYSFCLVSNIIHINYPGLTTTNVQQKVLIPIGGTTAISNTIANTYYFENVTLFGNCEFKAVNGKCYFNNCRFHYAGGDQISFQNLTESILFQCKLGFSLGDGVDYNNSFGIEIDCFLTHHGQMLSSNQNSTGHINSRIIRIGGIYQFAQDSNIYDISGTHSLNLGCTIGGINRRTLNGTPPQANIVSGYNSMMWLDDIKVGGGFGGNVCIKTDGHLQNPVGQIFYTTLNQDFTSPIATKLVS